MIGILRMSTLFFYWRNERAGEESPGNPTLVDNHILAIHPSISIEKKGNKKDQPTRTVPTAQRK